MSSERLRLGKKALAGYLGDNPEAWREWDVVELIKSGKTCAPLLVDQGTEDEFLANELLPQSLQEACNKTGQILTLRMQAVMTQLLFCRQFYRRAYCLPCKGVVRRLKRRIHRGFINLFLPPKLIFRRFLRQLPSQAADTAPHRADIFGVDREYIFGGILTNNAKRGVIMRHVKKPAHKYF